MNSAVRKYLRQMKKHLCCPRSVAKPYLRQLRDELMAWCDEQGGATLPELSAHFGAPEEAATEFLAQLDAWEVNRCAYARLKRSNAVLAALVAAIILMAGCQASSMLAPRAAAEIRYTQPILHKNGMTCEMFWVKTKFRGNDTYWEYHSCTEEMCLIGKPDSADGTEPYAQELYINGKDGVSHWKFNDLHMFWVKVRDEEAK